MTARDVGEILESWAPKGVAWERDNVGFQVGTPSKPVRRVLIALDLSDAVLREAIQKKIDLIITHHPLIFRPLHSVLSSDRIGSMVTRLIENDIALYSAHTNLDCTRDGVSHALAHALLLRDVRFLSGISGTLKKVAVFVPADHVDKVAREMGEAGAGIIGRYEHCSFRTRGTGTFRAMEGAKPFIGTAGKYESSDEVRLEMVVPRWSLQRALHAMRASHPYEEVAFDVYPLENDDPNYGAGAVGNLRRSVLLRDFLRHVRKRLSVIGIRYVGRPDMQVRRVAVCGGSGTDLLKAAIEQQADVFVTADLRYHTFQEADPSIALVDAGHFETERVVLPAIAEKLKQASRKRGLKLNIFTARNEKNPVQFF
ncbi:MAG TPA: Nif3-like dinuclear metal center hexameric protein [Bacteroidota bacterium]